MGSRADVGWTFLITGALIRATRLGIAIVQCALHTSNTGEPWSLHIALSSDSALRLRGFSSREAIEHGHTDTLALVETRGR